MDTTRVVNLGMSCTGGTGKSYESMLKAVSPLKTITLYIITHESRYAALDVIS